MQRIRGKRAFFQQGIDGICERDETTGDRSGASSAVGLQHIAVDRDGALAQSFQIHDGAQRAADQALYFLRAAGLLAARSFARRTRVRGPWQHAVFSRDPPLAGAAQKRRHAFLDTRGAKHPGPAESHQYRALRVLCVAADERQGT